MSAPGTSAWARQYYGPGWPDCAGQGKYMTTVKAFGRNQAWNRKCKRALRYLDRVFRNAVPDYYKDICKAPDVGTYNCRPIAGTGSPSFHSFGIAEDIRWGLNARDGDKKSEMRNRGMPAVHRVERLAIFVWGGRWDNPDDMHFEVVMTPKQIRARLTWRGKVKRKYRHHA